MVPVGLNIQTFYFLCRQVIYDSGDMYESVLERLSKSEFYEEKDEPVLVRSWINTIDNVDSSLLMTDTYKTLQKLTTINDLVLYITIITEITVILNNIFYSEYKSHKAFWRNSIPELYYCLICNVYQFRALEIKETATCTLEVNDYYHRFFTVFQDKCSRLGISIRLEEYSL